MDALQDRDLAGDAMDSDPEAMDVEGDAAWRSIRLAGECEQMPGFLRRLAEIGQ
jgi:hypothetical protein